METPPNDRNHKGRSSEERGVETVIVESMRKVDYLQKLGHPLRWSALHCSLGNTGEFTSPTPFWLSH